jgi:hypothetical protein
MTSVLAWCLCGFFYPPSVYEEEVAVITQPRPQCQQRQVCTFSLNHFSVLLVFIRETKMTQGTTIHQEVFAVAISPEVRFMLLTFSLLDALTSRRWPFGTLCALDVHALL